MMKTMKAIIIAIILIGLMVGSLSADAAPLDQGAANLPWTIQTVDGNEEDVINLSTAFVGLYEIPMMSYARTGLHRIYQVHLATPEVSGNCGPDDAWYCTSYYDSDIIPSTVSNIATYRYGPDTFGTKWVFGAGTKIRGASVERRNDMTFVTESWVDLIDLGKFGGTIVGAPSLYDIGGRYRLAVTIRSSGDFPTYSLVYMYRSGTSNSSCLTSGTSAYQCDVIETSIGYGSMGPPSLQIVDSAIGIAYYKSNAIRYAYPWSGVIFRPSNCGPGGNTWRCIDIVKPSSGTLGTAVDLAFGSTTTAKGIVYNFKPTTKDFVMRAIYVGSGGDCGQDGTSIVTSNPIYRWSCSDVDAFIDNIAVTTYSIAFDESDYPVVAYNNKFTGDTAQRLYVSYPDARLGLPGAGWHRYIVDGNDLSTTGTHSDISINSSGLSFIGFMQPIYRYKTGLGIIVIDNTPNLRIALQWFRTYMPTVRR